MRRDPSRRRLIGALGAAGAVAFVDPGTLLARIAAEPPCDPREGGELLGTLPLGRAGWRRQPFGVKFGGSGLDARLVTDLSLLRPDALITSNARAYIRTEVPPAVAAHRGPWTIRLSGLAAAPIVLALDELMRAARPMGAHLFECAGNDNPANFGLMSVAEWDGVPLSEVIARWMPSPSSSTSEPSSTLSGSRGSRGASSAATGVLVGGVDHEEQSSGHSVAGASWVLPLAALDRLGAFLAVRMNGAPIPLDHGWPVRLVVPRWYGCAWIKWVNDMRLVGDDEPATSQMIEFAGRTHQTARHALARDYAAPAIETAAMPVRVEKRRMPPEGRPVGPATLDYRIVGIVWGGARPVSRLEIRVGANEAWRPVTVCPAPGAPAIWSLWDYRWRPDRTGLYDIVLRVPDPSVPQRRLDSGYYMRQVNIDQVYNFRKFVAP